MKNTAVTCVISFFLLSLTAAGCSTHRSSVGGIYASPGPYYSGYPRHDGAPYYGPYRSPYGYTYFDPYYYGYGYWGYPWYYYDDDFEDYLEDRYGGYDFKDYRDDRARARQKFYNNVKRNIKQGVEKRRTRRQKFYNSVKDWFSGRRDRSRQQAAPHLGSALKQKISRPAGPVMRRRSAPRQQGGIGVNNAQNGRGLFGRGRLLHRR